jgi:RNA 3'-terminal phosphate cyclase (ATP)
VRSWSSDRPPVLEIDGSQGEGGGQILRTSLGLSLLTGTPFRLHSIRAGRPRPGLQRQHLAAVFAAQAVGHAEVKGAALGSREIVFGPGRAEPGSYAFSTGTAGSATLVLETVLPALLGAGGPSALALEGGTHNPWAPPFDFLDRTFLPLLNRMGPTVTGTLGRRGFYPAGGGRISVSIRPATKLLPIELLERGGQRAIRATAVVASLPAHIAERELEVVRQRLAGVSTRALVDTGALGPGNVLMIEIECDRVTEVFTGFGEKGLAAERVAARACDEVQGWLDAGVPVGEHLADQLLIPLAMAGAGAFVTTGLSGHATTNMQVIREFLGTRFTREPAGGPAVRVSVGAG